MIVRNQITSIWRLLELLVVGHIKCQIYKIETTLVGDPLLIFMMATVIPLPRELVIAACWLASRTQGKPNMYIDEFLKLKQDTAQSKFSLSIQPNILMRFMCQQKKTNLISALRLFLMDSNLLANVNEFLINSFL